MKRNVKFILCVERPYPHLFFRLPSFRVSFVPSYSHRFLFLFSFFSIHGGCYVEPITSRYPHFPGKLHQFRLGVYANVVTGTIELERFTVTSRESVYAEFRGNFPLPFSPSREERSLGNLFGFFVGRSRDWISNIRKLLSPSTREIYERKWHGILRRTKLLFYLDSTSAHRPAGNLLPLIFSLLFLLESRPKGLIFSCDFRPSCRQRITFHSKKTNTLLSARATWPTIFECSVELETPGEKGSLSALIDKE